MPVRQLCNFFAVLENGDVRKIDLTQTVIPSIKKIFVDGGVVLFNDAEEIPFTGNYKVDPNEILYVELTLPDNFIEAIKNPIGIHELNLKEDEVKTLFWFEDGSYYFQNFDKRKLLRNKSIIVYSNQTFNLLKDDGLIIDNIVNAVYREGKFYFLSYTNANKIFSLVDFYHEATDEEIRSFGTGAKVNLDVDWFLGNTNSTIRKQITLLHKSNVLTAANTGKIQRRAKRFKLGIDLDGEGKICFPNDKKACKEIFLFLNEQYWEGLISGTKYKTNNKREVKIAT